MSCDVPRASYRPSIAPRPRSARGPSRHPTFPAPRVFFPKSHRDIILTHPPLPPFPRQPAGKKVAPTPSGMKAPKAEKKETAAAPAEKKAPFSFLFNKPTDPKLPEGKKVTELPTKAEAKAAAKAAKAAPAAPAAPATSDAAANAKDAQKWIDSWKKNAPAAGSDAAGNAKEAQEWIDAWMKNK